MNHRKLSYNYIEDGLTSLWEHWPEVTLAEVRDALADIETDLDKIRDNAMEDAA